MHRNNETVITDVTVTVTGSGGNVSSEVLFGW